MSDKTPEQKYYEAKLEELDKTISQFSSKLTDLTKQAEKEFTDGLLKYKDRLDQSVSDFSHKGDEILASTQKEARSRIESLESKLKWMLSSAVILLIGVCIATIFSFRGEVTKQADDAIKGINDSVISLQGNIISANNTIRQSTGEIDKALKETKAAVSDLKSTRAEYEKRLKQLQK
jgi:prefoldin subunit 5